MAMDQWLSVLLMPVLFALLHLAGLVLALAYWRRCPAACSLLFTASILHLIAVAGRLGLTFLEMPGRGQFFSEMLWVLSGLNWLGYGLMLMAIFAGRNEPTLAPARSPRQSPDDDEETDLVPLQPAPSTRDSTGIQVR